MLQQPDHYPCPTCRKPTPWEQPFKPFCSERCRLIDLGQWASESHRIGTQEAADLHEHDDPEES